MASGTAGSNLTSVVYPQGQVEGFRTLSVGLALVATTAISYCFAQRAYHVDFFSRRGLSSINLTKWLLLMLFVDSWAFVFLSGILINGIGMSLSPAACTMGIFTCIVFYCMSKLLTYLFLLEKVYIVWPSKGGRFSSIPYRVGFCAILGFALVLIMMVIGRIAYLTDDNQCIIGLSRASSMTTLFVDLFVNILLTSLFLWPLWRSKLLSPNIRHVASRTLVASFSALTISAVNLTILTILHGQELGWICLASCSTDVVVNAIVLFWLTRPGHANDEPTSNGGPNSNHHHKSENGKSVGGGVVQLHRISVNPGVHGNGHTGPFTSNASLNGLSKISTGLQIPPNTDTPPRSPMKVNFSGYPSLGVYDGSQPYVREPIAPSIDDKSSSQPGTPTSVSFPQPPGEVPAYLKNQKRHSVGLPPPPRDLPSFFTDQKRHSVGFIYEKTVTTGGSANGSISPAGLFNKIIGKRSPLDGHRSPTPSGKRRRGSDEDVGVRITVTTMFDNDESFINSVNPNRSSEDQSKAASERFNRAPSPFRG